MPSLNNVIRKIAMNTMEPIPGAKFPMELTKVDEGSKEIRVNINDATATIIETKEITAAVFLLMFR